MTRTRVVGLTASAATLAALAGVGLHLARPDLAERIDLHGTWRVVSREVEGREVPARPGETVVIDGLAMTFSIAADEADAGGSPAGPFRLDAAASPKGMDIRFPLPNGSAPANRWDGLTRAVYERDRDVLRLAWHTNSATNPDPNGRPQGVIRGAGPHTMRLILGR